MSIKTDLAKEIIDKFSPSYAKKRKFFYKSTEITEVFIETEEEAAFFKKPMGTYITVESDFPKGAFEKFDEEVSALSSELSKMIPEKVSNVANRVILCYSLNYKAMAFNTSENK